MYIEHQGADAVDVDYVDIYWQDSQKMYCRRMDDGKRNIGILDNNDLVELVCSP